MSNPLELLRMHKTKFVGASLTQSGDDRAFWHSRTPEERLEALELMRQIYYGYDPATARILRVYQIVDLGES